MPRKSTQRLTVLGATAVLLSVAACGTTEENTGTGGKGGTAGNSDSFTLGTTDTVTAIDPAGSYDLGSWTLQYNIYQTPLTVPPGETKPTGDAAKSCEYNDPQTLTCTLQPGLKFSNGHALTSSDVKFSLERNIRIADENGDSSLLASVASTDKAGNMVVDPKAIETPDDTTVVFHLNHPDTTFQYVLTTPAADIVDEQVFPADKKLADDQVIGSGPYALDEYESGQQAVLTANSEYTGPNSPQAPSVFITYYQEPSALKLAVENGEVDIAWRSLSPTDVKDLQSSGDVTVANGQGSEIRYFVFNCDGGVTKNPAVRQAIAHIIDRDKIAQVAYANTVSPLYSFVAPALPGSLNTFQTDFGAPSVTKAKQVLQQAGVKTPIKLTLGYTPSHYGPNSVDEATEVQSELNSSGLFNVSLKSAEWTQYQTLYKQDAYDMWQLGWFPDFVDADNYLAPFLVDGGFYENGYTNEQINKLVAKEQGTPNPAAREQIFGQIQRLATPDVPTLPSWVGKNVAVYGDGISGVEDTLDVSFIFRLWMITKAK